MQVLAAGYTEESPQILAGLLPQLAPPYPVGYTTREEAAKFAQVDPENRAAMPLLLFLDRSHRVRARHAQTEPFFQNPERNVRAKLDELLAEPPPAKPPAKKKKQ